MAIRTIFVDRIPKLHSIANRFGKKKEERRTKLSLHLERWKTDDTFPIHPMPPPPTSTNNATSPSKGSRHFEQVPTIPCSLQVRTNLEPSGGKGRNWRKKWERAGVDCVYKTSNNKCESEKKRVAKPQLIEQTFPVSHHPFPTNQTLAITSSN